MPGRTVIHGTFVIERIYPPAPARVFAAFADPAKKRRWYAEGGTMLLDDFRMDFRTGGSDVAAYRFGPGLPIPEGTPMRNDTRYQDIVPNVRIVFAYTMTMGDRCISSSQATVEFVPAAKGTNLVFTEQGAYFEGADGPAMRENGWQKLLGQLAAALASDA